MSHYEGHIVFVVHYKGLFSCERSEFLRVPGPLYRKESYCTTTPTSLEAYKEGKISKFQSQSPWVMSKITDSSQNLLNRDKGELGTNKKGTNFCSFPVGPEPATPAYEEWIA